METGRKIRNIEKKKKIKTIKKNTENQTVIKIIIKIIFTKMWRHLETKKLHEIKI